MMTPSPSKSKTTAGMVSQAFRKQNKFTLRYNPRAKADGKASRVPPDNVSKDRFLLCQEVGQEV